MYRRGGREKATHIMNVIRAVSIAPSRGEPPGRILARAVSTFELVAGD